MASTSAIGLGPLWSMSTLAAEAVKSGGLDANRDAPPQAAAPAGLPALFPRRQGSDVFKGLPPRVHIRAHNRGTSKEEDKRVEDVRSRQDAEHELLIPAAQTTSAVVTSPATIRAHIDEVTDPIAFTALQIGLSAQSFQPGGSFSLPGFNSYDLTQLGARPMVDVQLRWTPIEMPITVGPFSRVVFGGYASLGYAQHDVILRNAEVGTVIDRAKVYTIQTEAGAALEWHLSHHERWSLATLFGLGRMESTQAGNSSFSQASAASGYASTTALIQSRVFDRATIFAGYEHLFSTLPDSREYALQRDVYLAGFLGSFK